MEEYVGSSPTSPTYSIFEEVNNLKKWNKWSPWEKADTTMVTSFEGPEKGVGAIMKWTSEMGDGQMTIIESIDNKQLRNKLEFTRRGMETKGLWLFEETEEGTNITWTFTGDVGFNPIAKYMMMFMRKEIDNSQKQGLESLKEICEAKP